MKFASILLASLLIVISPWMIGGNYLYFQTVLLVVAAIFGLMAAMTCLVERKAFSTSLLWFLLPAGIAYTIYQTLPASGPISIYPSASKAEIYVLGSAITLFLSSVVLLRDQKSIGVVLFSIGAVGFAVAFVGVVQNLGFNGKVLWVYDLLYGGQPFGPFVNKNNGAGFLILTLAGPMYFLSRQLLRALKKSGLSHSQADDTILPDSRKRRSKSKTNPFNLLMSAFAHLEAKHLYGITGLVVIVVGVFLSFSRGGSISVVFALTVGIAMLMTANRWAIMLAAIVIVVGIGAVVWTEQADVVQEKLATITDVERGTEARLLHWKDAMPYYEAHALLGSGLGTYRYEYPKFQQHRFQKKFGHAENVYLETLAELGVFGVAALVITLLILFYCSIKLFRQKSSSDRALGVGATTALVGLTAASCLDFGIYQPANFIVAAILFGAVVGRAGSPELGKPNDSKTSFPGNYIRFAILLVLVLGLAYATFPSSAVESAKYARRQIALHIKDDGAGAFRITKAKNALNFANQYLKDDWEVQYLLGQCEVFQHRQNLTKELQEETEERLLAQGIEAGLSEEEIEEQFPSRSDYWATTSIMNLHRVMRLTQTRNYEEYLRSRQDSEMVTPELQNAWKHFNESLACCDRSERVHYRLAQLSVLLGDEKDNLAEETMHVNNALEMAKGYTGLLYDAGLLALHSGQYDRAAELWADCISRTRRYEPRIVQFGLGLPAKTYFEQVLPQNPQDLLRISRRYFSSDDQRVPNELLLVHTRRLIKNSELDDVKKWELTGQAWFRAKDYQKAIVEYERALSTKPNRPVWRLDYANCLAKVERYDDAIREMIICQLEQPDAAIRIGRLVERTKRERIRARKSQREEEQADQSSLRMTLP